MHPCLPPIAALLTVTVLLAGCGGGEATGPAATTGAATGTAAAPTPAGAEPDGDRGDPDEERPAGADDDARAAAAGRAAAAYRAYIAAINDRDGAALCALLTPAAVGELNPPVERSSCAATLRDSIGYRDPRGLPVWKRTTLSSIDGTQVSADLDSARITAAITTGFADRAEPSVESDIAYLERDGGWRLVKPSGALYRAVGDADLPPSVIAPPQG